MIAPGQVFSGVTLVVVLTTTVIAVLFWHACQLTAFPSNAPVLWLQDHVSFIGSIRFFLDRQKMLENARQASKTGNISFYIGRKQVVSIGPYAGARKTFFDTKELSFIMGVTLLSTQTPPGPPAREAIRVSQWFNKMLITMMRKEHLAGKLEYLTGDVKKAMEMFLSTTPQTKGWHVMNPFSEIYGLIFRLSNRGLGAFEVAEDNNLMIQVLEIFQKFDEYNDRYRILLPWLPSREHFWRFYYAAKLFLILRGIANKRGRSGKKRPDTVQYLLDQGCSIQEVVTFEIGSLFAGQLNSGIMISWLFIYWSQDQSWKARIQQEVDEVVACNRTSPGQTVIEVLGNLTLDQWESSFKLIDLSLRETIRIGLTGSDFRKNVSSRDIQIGSTGEVIPPGAFAVLQLDDVHMNTDIYTDPGVFDPDRFNPERTEDKKAAHSYVGWGSGRHPCPGSRFAKLEAAIVCAYFVALFDFERSDAHGRGTNIPAVIVDRSANSVKKPNEPVYIRYRLRSHKDTPVL